MPIRVPSEVSQLKRVLLHRPGAELEHLYPDSLPRLLFDDIPFLERAQEEHDAFADILRKEGVEVVYLEDLAAEAIASSPAVRQSFIEEFIRHSGIFSPLARTLVQEELDRIENPRELILTTMAGMEYDRIDGLQPKTLATMVGREPQVHILEPIPNLYFTRDTFASIGNGASLHPMYSPTRQRESIYAKYILRYHPEYKDVPLYYTPEMPPSLEGGDILNLTEKVLAVGLSQRTGPGAVETLAKNLFLDETSQIETVLAFMIPSRRAYMHLDTVFTQVDRDTFVIHPGIEETAEIYALSHAGEGEVAIKKLEGSLNTILERYLAVEKVHLIPCGGTSRVAAEREQWNDGSNTLCISPGKVIVYDRNTITNQLLEEHGIEVLRMPSSELSRGRGGPRCMSMPLWRE